MSGAAGNAMRPAGALAAAGGHVGSLAWGFSVIGHFDPLRLFGRFHVHHAKSLLLQSPQQFRQRCDRRRVNVVQQQDALAAFLEAASWRVKRCRAA